MITHHSYDQTVKEWQGTAHDAVVANCKGVETAHENTCFLHFGGKDTIFFVTYQKYLSKVL
jgi:hypothetical protein